MDNSDSFDNLVIMFKYQLSFLLRRPLNHVIALFILIPSIGAAEVTEFVGSWRLHGLETPARLQERFYNEVTGQFRTGFDASAVPAEHEYIVDVFFPDPFAGINTSFTLAPDGNISGGVQAQFRNFRSNRFTYQEGSEVFTVFANVAGDILKRSDAIPEMYNLYIGLKSPESLTVSDLHGTWDIVTYTTPQDIVVNKFEGRVVDTFFIGQFRTLSATISIDPVGAIEGDFDGTAEATGPGTVSFDIDGSIYHFSINASKNVLVGSLSQSSETEYLVLVKRPESLSTSELSGNWRFTALEVPTSFRKRYYNQVSDTFQVTGMSYTSGPNEQFIDIYHIGEFSNLRLDLHVNEDGSFSQLGGGTLTAGIDNRANLFVDNKTIIMNPNSDKTMLTGLISDSNSQILVIGIRVQGKIANTFNESVELDLTPTDAGDPFVLSWKGATYLMLQTYNSEEGIWEDVEFSNGQDSLTADPEQYGSTGLFRIIEVLASDEEE